MSVLRTRIASPGLVAVATVGVILGGLLAGYEPVGGDPDRLYRPIKTELARALHAGELPFWSDRFGLGVPLVAESHVAAFYPPNWLLYSTLDVSTAYRFSMWLHYLALAAATYAYARRLGVLPWGSALASLAFTLCGFQAIHSSHEPLYSALPYLPLALCFADNYARGGRWRSLAALSLTIGAQLTLGHFQIALWTAILTFGLATSRLIAERRSRWRALGLAGAIAGGASIAALQVVPSWNQAQLVGSTDRTLQELTFFAYPPAHWAELAVPRLFHGLAGGPEGPYWYTQGTTGYEASLYVGTVPLILALAGLTRPGSAAVTRWRVIVLASFALATMPAWWPGGYQLFLQLPGIGYFRAPGRFTLITSLGLALLGGRGLDCDVTSRQFAIGLGLAAGFGVTATMWAIYWSRSSPYAAALAPGDLRRFLSLAAIVWVSSLGAILLWRTRRLGPAALFALTALELGILYYHGTTEWARSIDLPDRSPVLRRLATEPNVGTVAGYLDDLPVRAGQSPTYPYLGMRLSPPTGAMEFARYVSAADDSTAGRLMRRMGVTHGVWNTPVSSGTVDVLYEGPDEALDRLVYKPPAAPLHATWYLVRYRDVDPPLHVALQALDAPDLPTALIRVARDPSARTAWFQPGERPRDSGPRARSARVLQWDGRTAVIEHDGDCDVIIRRTYSPGWTARLDDGPAVPVTPANGGLQSVHLSGAGRTRIALQYRPPYFYAAAVISLVSLLAAAAVWTKAWRSGGQRPGSVTS